MNKIAKVLIVVASIVTLIGIISRIGIIPGLGVQVRSLIGFAGLLLLFAIALEGLK